ncbi:unnamed protein product [Bursaphelenchus xylophilus]|uniref:Fructose-bisphosphate aldolase n=1 Tax=Bursaphelenchus xylophilus TaxID=6326 RepID=A0A1I7RW56_BURXY|nr:unnamed protein product [Bursaphelenchus xylophilus]CAG9095152.1 unnamed protein product [Bursaphelenchus xylophilus]
MIRISLKEQSQDHNIVETNIMTGDSLSEACKSELKAICSQILQPRKGILATDDTAVLMAPRLQAVGKENSTEERRKYRQMLYSAPRIADNITAIIMMEETFRQKNDEGVRFVDHLNRQGVNVGVQADLGLLPLNQSQYETHTKGLEGLEERVKAYKAEGAVFAKWRAALTIGEGRPSRSSLIQNASELAEFAKVCQKHGLVPFVEPDVVRDGSHSLQECQKATELALEYTFRALHAANVFLEGMILKPNMVTAGTDYKQHQPTPAEVASATLAALQRHVPASVPGIAFLSGGQEDTEATKNLNAIAQQQTVKPWILTFCYGRAIQRPVMKAWAGKDENIRSAHEVLHQYAKNNGLAQRGEYIIP